MNFFWNEKGKKNEILSSLNIAQVFTFLLYCVGIDFLMHTHM